MPTPRASATSADLSWVVRSTTDQGVKNQAPTATRGSVTAHVKPIATRARWSFVSGCPSRLAP